MQKNQTRKHKFDFECVFEICINFGIWHVLSHFKKLAKALLWPENKNTQEKTAKTRIAGMGLAHGILELSSIATFQSCLPRFLTGHNFHKSKVLDTFLHSNFHSKDKTPVDDAGQLETYCSCGALPTALSWHVHAFETLFFRLTHMVGGANVLVEVWCWCTFSVFSHVLTRSFLMSSIWFKKNSSSLNRTSTCENTEKLH